MYAFVGMIRSVLCECPDFGRSMWCNYLVAVAAQALADDALQAFCMLHVSVVVMI